MTHSKKLDFNNLDSFLKTKPYEIIISNKNPYSVKSWKEAYVYIFQFFESEYTGLIPLRISLLEGNKIDYGDLDDSYEMRRPAQISADRFIETNICSDGIVKRIKALLDFFCFPYEQLEIFFHLKSGNVADESCNKISPLKSERIDTGISSEKNVFESENNVIIGKKIQNDSLSEKVVTVSQKSDCRCLDIKEVENYIKTKGLQGASIQEIIDAVQSDNSVLSMENALDENMNILAMPGHRFVHEESFVDLDEAEEILQSILNNHFRQFGGYSNSQLLFTAASQELSMFMNDNNCKNTDDVYAIACFLFEKKRYAGKKYKFVTPHIFEVEPNFPPTHQGLMINLARKNDGILYESDAKNYLQKIMLTFPGMSQVLRIGVASTFFIYDDEKYLLSEAIDIDDAWCLRMHNQIDDLFMKANVAYVIPRDISTSWLSSLPSLPHNLAWTRLLLQQILDMYPSIGFKCISADIGQSYRTIAAAIVPQDSPLQSFSDVVTLYMQDHHNLPMRMKREDLRKELRDAGMLEAREMQSALHKALDDYRFAWTDENKTVLVRGNK